MTRAPICLLLLTLFLTGVPLRLTAAQPQNTSPNFIVIYADDLGYGDLGCFGHPTIRTPHLDRMAADGMKFTQFYSAACVCTPSRAALLTGRLPQRNGMCSDKRRVLFPDSAMGLPANEITIAEALKARGYATACVGKWHLGHLEPYLPTENGFDAYFGIPYSNDMDRVADAPKGKAAFWDPKIEYWNVPLMRDTKVIERPAQQQTITRRYTEQAIQFIKQHQQQPFFLYMPHTMPHVPLFRDKKFVDASRRGLYGDIIEEIDWSVGQVLETLRSLKLDQRTLVFFSSDNGPWLTFNQQGGSAGLLRGGKGSTWEGGMREPTLAWWPQTIDPASVCMDLASTMDIFATIGRLSGFKMPEHRTMDSHDLTPLLTGEGKSTRDAVIFYRGYRLMAARVGSFKAHFITQPGYGGTPAKTHDPPLLFNLDVDPSEKYNVADQHPEVLKQIQQRVAEHKSQMVFAPSQLEKRIER